MKTTKKLTAAIVLLAIIFATSCKKDPTTPILQQELITTVKLMLTDTAAPFTTYTFQYKDLDGDGPIVATLDSVKLPIGKVFRANLLLLDESKTPADTTSNEIEELNIEHQFFYKSTPTDVISNFIYLNFDDNGKPLGSEFSFQTKSTSSFGNLLITLRHLPNKDGVNVSSGDITNANGETDVEIVFPVRLY